MDNRSSQMRKDPLTQASEFFIEFRAGDATPSVRAEFEKWLYASPEHVQAYLQIAAGWSELPTADPEDHINVPGLLATTRGVTDENVIHLRIDPVDTTPRSLARRMRPWTLGAALTLLVTLAGAGIWAFIQSGGTYNTGVGEQRTLILADGSTVTLNALTTVRILITREAREITLVRGQAYFHDTDDPARPFVVRIGKSAVRALGTEFDVDRELNQTVVTVLQGQVVVESSFNRIYRVARSEILQELEAPGGKLKAVLVSAGQQVTVLAQDIPAPKAVDVTAVTAWLQQRLIFDATPLEQVAQQFNLYSKRRLVIADPSLRSVDVSGVYSASDPAALIGFLESQPTLHVVATNDKFILTKR